MGATLTQLLHKHFVIINVFTWSLPSLSSTCPPPSLLNPPIIRRAPPPLHMSLVLLKVFISGLWPFVKRFLFHVFILFSMWIFRIQRGPHKAMNASMCVDPR